MAAESTIQDLGRFLEDGNRLIPEEVRDRLKRFASRLNFVNAFIKNSEGKGDQNEVVRETIQQLTKTVQKAEVVIKDFMLAVEKQKRSSTFVSSMSIGPCCLAVDRNTWKISNTIDDILDNFQRYGISMNVGGHCDRPNTRATFESTVGENSSTYTFEIANPVVRSIRDKEPSDLKFEIESFQALLNSTARMRSTERIESSEFTSGGYSWVMIIYLNGNTKDNGTGHVSFYLRLVEKPTGRNSVNASFKFFILDKQRETYITIHDGKERKFDAGHLEWGISQALPIATFIDASNGLLVNDSCTFGAEVYVIKNTPTLVRLSLMQKTTLRSHPWVVDYFPLLNKETYSSIFPIEGRHWKLCLYPKGNLRGKDKYLSLYLYLVDATDLTDGRKLYADFVLSIKDQLNDSDHEKSVGFWFDSGKDHEGFDDFLPLTELNNPLKGYKANGTVIIATTINEMFLVTQVS
ncbi:hypothetical protein Ancab_028292 [Ancistrocladus abbreviatus]